jgi:sulfide dehydrogenase cytochrome subunit
LDNAGSFLARPERITLLCRIGLTCAVPDAGEARVNHSSKQAGACALLVGLALAAPVALAQEQAARSLAANCTGCHGPNGNSAGAIPSIAGLEKAYFIAALQEFKAGTRPATVMHQHARGYTDQEFELLADYFSRQKRQ